MLSTNRNPLQFMLICALVLMSLLYYYQATRHTEQLAAAEARIARLSTTLATKELGRTFHRVLGSMLIRIALHRIPPQAVDDVPYNAPEREKTPVSRDLIMYSYHETEMAATNFAFFRKHAFHAKADFIIIINGEHTLDLSSLTALPNVRVIERENRCFDLGGYKEVFEGNATLLTYQRFILINASLRGPFIPPYADKICWSDAYWDKLDEKTKLVGKHTVYGLHTFYSWLTFFPTSRHELELREWAELSSSRAEYDLCLGSSNTSGAILARDRVLCRYGECCNLWRDSSHTKDHGCRLRCICIGRAIRSSCWRYAEEYHSVLGLVSGWREWRQRFVIWLLRVKLQHSGG